MCTLNRSWADLSENEADEDADVILEPMYKMKKPDPVTEQSMEDFLTQFCSILGHDHAPRHVEQQVVCVGIVSYVGIAQ